MHKITPPALHDFNIKDIALFFLCGSALVLISDIPSTWGSLFYIARGILALLLLSTLFLPSRFALLLLFMLAIAGQDIVSFGDYSDPGLEYSTASIWQMRLGPINPGAIVFGCMFWQLLRLTAIKAIAVPLFVKRAILWFATVPVITALFYGGFSSENAGIEAFVDIRFALMLITSILVFLSLFKKDPHYLYKFLAVFAGVLLARHFMDFIYVATNLGPAIAEGVTRGSEDSAKGAVVFLVFLGLILICIHKRVILGMALVIPAILLVVAYGTRNLWITSILGLIILALYLGLRRSLSFIAVGVILSIVGTWTLSMVNPESAEVVFARSKSFTEGYPIERFGVMVDYNLISRIDQVRYAQIFNVFDSIKRRNAFLWGTGYGGYYEDDVFPFPSVLKTAFPDYSFETGKYYRTHQFTTHMLLKHGLLGFICIVSLWFIPGYTLYKLFRQRNMFAADQPRMLNGMILCMAAFLPTGMFQTFWSAKGLLINGMVIACCMEFARHYPPGTTEKGSIIKGLIIRGN